MDLLDALCSLTQAKSVVELSLQSCFRRTHSAIFKALDSYRPGQDGLAHLAGPHLPPPEQRTFWLVGVDVTPQSRPYAQMLAERGFVYQPSVIWSNKPITIGHQIWSWPGTVDSGKLGKKEMNMPRTRPPYSLEFRQQILELLRTGRTPNELAREFEPSGETIRQWVKQAELDADQRQDGLTTDQKAEIAKLRREVKRLKQEQEILKKAAAWFAQEKNLVRPRSSSS